MDFTTKIYLQRCAGWILMVAAAIITLPYGSMLLVHWPWLFRFNRHTVTIWNFLELGEAGFVVYQKVVFGVGLPLAALGTFLLALARKNEFRWKLVQAFRQVKW